MSPKTKAFLLAARPKTLPAALCPVVAGSALAWRLEGAFSWLLLWATLLSTIAIQVATNYFNDAVDAAKGADTGARLGPLRATAAGLVSRREMLLAGGIAALAAAACSVPLVMERGWPIVVIGVVSLFFSYGYTGGPWPLAYRGLGELFVMIFFGFVAAAGTVFVHSGVWRAESLLLGLQMGSLSTVLIAINNLRDVEEDTRSRKRTLAVRCGVKAAKGMIVMWCVLPLLAGYYWGTLGVMDGGTGMTMVIIICSSSVIMGILRLPPSRAYNRLLALGSLQLVLWTVYFVKECLRG